ncbi:ShlB/FhaC/HecB family hemolysin secretion/activation protein [Sphingomonas sp. BIUV-7]|uniref:ShlB/FhaC/HecB family hemolysin secretion/activation protein n=1 Tax=Sphingomonas natans TaxID=3063330 RepID=A0ABT8Y9F6_9SPHN|nr:ShlB/FhaC/HecB family hemolysin secretion/activation protein [Sphingomonas sp. BIUV-7]MDO6414612.1 ShlB/FhaC/HecB family hemolysin secretion/activation protein [Sphingomonas sp. BIUV-7]
MGHGAGAQRVAQPPSALANGGLPTREEVTRPGTTPPAQGARLKVEGDIERAACPLDDPSYKDARIAITGATFHNLGPVSPAELAPVYQRYLGNDRPAGTICEIRDAAATLLRQKGYLAAIQVPTQKIENGVVIFEVLYARLAAVRVRGDAGRNEQLIAGYLNKLTADPVFNRFSAERYLLLARDMPGYDVRLVLRPTGEKPGELLGDVIVTRTPFEADLNIQNFAARSTGRFSGQLTGRFYGLTGLGDRTTIGLFSSSDFREQQILQLAHDFRVGPEGLTFAGRFTYAWTKPDIRLNGNLRARTLFATGEASYPFLRSQRANLRGSAGFDYVDQDVRFAGTLLSRDHLRVAYLRLDGDRTDVRERAPARWRGGYSLELRHGLGIFNATDGTLVPGAIGPSRSNADSEATLVRASGFAELALTPLLSASIAPRVQYAFDPLLSFEEFSAGTYTIGRGYDPGTIIGDTGAGFSAELRINRVVPSTRTNLVMQPFLFIDSAWVWNRGATGDPQKLTSVGGGVRTSFASKVRLDLTAAVPTKRAGFQTRRGDTRILMSLTTRLFPWKDR